MSTSVPYDSAFEPPAPVLPALISAPLDPARSVALAMLVDSGADCTCIPASIARRLRLPVVDEATVEGAGGSTQTVTVHAASVEIAGRRSIIPVVALGSESILGRDVMARWVVTLDGPRQRLVLRAK